MGAETREPDPGPAIAFVRALHPAAAAVWSHTDVPVAVLLAWAAHETAWGLGPALTEERNPWGLPAPATPGHRRWPWGAARPDAPAPTRARFPDLSAAAAATAAALHPTGHPAAAAAWPERHDPPRYLEALARAGWPAAAADPAGWTGAVSELLPVVRAAAAVAQAGVPVSFAFGPPGEPWSMEEAVRRLGHLLPAEHAAVFLAVAAAESGLDPWAASGPAAEHPEADLVAALAAADPLGARPRPSGTPGPYTRFGLWQLDTTRWARLLARETRSPDPYVWALWLRSPEASARAAVEAFRDRRGFGTWPSYADGSYRAHLAAAEAALAGRDRPQEVRP